MTQPDIVIRGAREHDPRGQVSLGLSLLFLADKTVGKIVARHGDPSAFWADDQRPHGVDRKRVRRDGTTPGVAQIDPGSLLQASHAVLNGFSTLHWRAAGSSESMIGVLWAEGVVAEIEE